MLKLKLNNEIIEIPSEPHEISLDKGLNLHYIWANQEHDLETKRELLEIIYPLGLFKELDENKLDEILNNLNFLDIEKIEDIQYYPSFKLNKTNFGIHNIDKLTLREYMDIEFYITYGDDPYEHMDKLCSILYRPIKSKTNSFKNILINYISNIMFKLVKPMLFKSYNIDKYNEDVDNTELFRSGLTYSMGIYALLSYFKFKETIIRDFSPIFNPKNTEHDPFEEEELAYLAENNIEDTKTFEESWGFTHIFFSLVPNLSERELWLDKNVTEFLTYLSYNNEKCINDNNKIKNKHG